MPESVLPPVAPIQHTEVDGVPTMWVDEPGPLVAALMFRVGRSDEPSPMGGISHIAEHLALAGLGVQDYDHNGFVDGTRTLFTSSGKPAEVVHFLDAVVRGLTDPPLDRLLLERRILREERDQRSPSIGGAVRWYRFGYAGHGRGLGPGDEELGLDWLGPEPIRTWIDDRFTRQNAVLWLTGAPPADLRLPLRDGPHHTVVAPETVPDVRFPSHVRWDGPAATIGFLGRRSPGVNMVANIAHRRMRQQLRFEHGLVYDVELDYEPLDAETAHVMFGAECPPDRVARVLGVLVEVLEELARNGPTPGELETEVGAYCRQFEERDGRIGLLDAVAMDRLWDGPIRTAQDFLDLRLAVDPAGAAGAIGTALESMLVLADADLVSDRFTIYPEWAPTLVTGREYSPSGFFLPGRKPKERLRSGPDGLSAVLSATEGTTVRYRDCVACVHLAPTSRALLGRDGTRIVVNANAWKDGQRIVDEIDAAVPADLVACAEHGIGSLEDPSEAEPVTASAVGG